MRPSEQIIQIVKQLVKEDTKTEYPYENWESLENLEQLKLMSDMELYLIKGILQYLDSLPTGNPPEEGKTR